MPLTMDEIQADKDRLRAEFAMSTRRLEMSVEALKERIASQTVDISRQREELKRVAEQRDARDAALTDVKAEVSQLRNELGQRDDALNRQSNQISELERRLEEKTSELNQVSQLHEEASIRASSLQIELVAQETKVEQMAEDLAVLRNERKEADHRVREIAAEALETREALRAERKKLATLERKLERTIASLAEGEEKLERREREIARLREQKSKAKTQDRSLVEELQHEQAERIRLEGEVAELTSQLSRLISGATAGDISAAVSKLEANRKSVEDRLTTLTRENKRLRTELEGVPQTSATPKGEDGGDAAMLREDLSDLAAQVVALAAALEGPDSPIHSALRLEQSAAGKGLSLADRVRALQKAAATPR